ncbi:class I SAM-dependent methyltransferase [Nonomuraea fuscirosea]|uniref:class I SAM-dependent methyltransferase n=1 Tax=Nonomuraea fuscirosea TaxID=1291556 RepID=UPI003436788E
MNHPDATHQQEPRDQEEEIVHRALEGFYSDGKPPWDTGVTPPELVALTEGPRRLPPGRALELGCGTGTNALYLARHGWDVTAVDLIDRAVERAREKAAEAGAAVRLLRGDATRLDELDAPGPFDLFFDLSCYCGIPLHRRDAYAAGLTRRAAPGARLLMFGYGPEPLGNPTTEIASWAAGVTADELCARFAGWELLDVTPGTNSVPTFWFTLRRYTSATS